MTNLISYGVQNEDSDIRIHVCVRVQRVYFYKTAVCRRLVDIGGYRTQTVRLHGQVSAEGYLVPPQDIPGCRSALIPPELAHEHYIKIGDHEEAKGKKAAAIALEMMRKGRVTLPLTVDEVPANTQQQIDGVDAMVRPLKLQIKCDFSGGERRYGGTGNLFIQTAERRVFA